MYLALVIILILAFAGTLPNWPHSNSWGYGPSGGIVGIIIVLVLLRLIGVL